MKPLRRTPRVLLLVLLGMAMAGCGAPMITAPANTSTAAVLSTPSGIGPPPSLPRDPDPSPQTVSTTDYESLSKALLEQRRTIEQLIITVDENTRISHTEGAQEIRSDIIPALDNLLTDANAINPADTNVAAVHQHLITSLHRGITAFTDLATGLETGNTTVFRHGQTERHGETAEMKAWVDGLTDLYGTRPSTGQHR